MTERSGPDETPDARPVGTALFAYVEEAFPARSWTLETPAWATSNLRFCAQRCGFRQVRVRDDGDEGTMAVLEKVRSAPSDDAASLDR